VLDLFAGSGALGLEALSRGARHVTFVETAHAAVQAIRANVESLDVRARTRLVAGEVRRALRDVKAAGGGIGLVFLDPPYAAADTGSLRRSLNSEMSAPDAKASSPCPRMTTTRTSRSAASGAMAPGIASHISRRTAFRRAGLRSVSHATPPVARSTSIPNSATGR